MKIVGVVAHLCHFPLPTPFYPSWIPGYPQGRNSALIVQLQTDEGITGISAGVVFLDEAKGLPSLLRPFLLNRDPFQVEDFIRVLRSASFLGYRAWFVEAALWDIIGKAAGMPVYKLLGGGTGVLRAYASTGELRDPDRRVEDVLAIREMGFAGVKLRIRYPTVGQDLAIVRAVRDAVGDSMEIMVDANQGWPIHGFAPYPRWDLKRALRTARALEELNVSWLEEPLYKHDYDGYAVLCSSTALPLAGGEFNSDLHEFRDLIQRGCLDILQPDVTLATGILNGKKVAGMAEAANLQFSPHTWTNGLGLAANLHLMAAVPNCPWCEYPYEPPGWTPEARDFMLTEPIRVAGDGTIRVLNGPGLGVELDMERIRACGQEI
jgi:D-galactarolactone cycloisomerase